MRDFPQSADSSASATEDPPCFCREAPSFWWTRCNKTKTALAAADRPTAVDAAVLLVLPRFTTVFGMGTGGAAAPLATSTGFGFCVFSCGLLLSNTRDDTTARRRDWVMRS